jgi:hypothetical protein
VGLLTSAGNKLRTIRTNRDRSHFKDLKTVTDFKNAILRVQKNGGRALAQERVFGLWFLERLIREVSLYEEVES